MWRKKSQNYLVLFFWRISAGFQIRMPLLFPDRLHHLPRQPRAQHCAAAESGAIFNARQEKLVVVFSPHTNSFFSGAPLASLHRMARDGGVVRRQKRRTGESGGTCTRKREQSASARATAPGASSCLTFQSLVSVTLKFKYVPLYTVGGGRQAHWRLVGGERGTPRAATTHRDELVKNVCDFGEFY